MANDIKNFQNDLNKRKYPKQAAQSGNTKDAVEELPQK